MVYIGKEVIISNKLGCYSFYSNLCKKYTDGRYWFQEGEIPENEHIGTVLFKAYIENRQINLFGILVDEQLFIMEEGSFKLVKEKKQASDLMLIGA